MERFEEILYPTQEEKERRIKQIVESGVMPPSRLSYALPELLRKVGVRGMFFGVGDCMFLAFLGAALIWTGFFSAFRHSGEGIYVMLFFISPFLYGLLHFLVLWKDIMTGTYELFMVCRISHRQMTVLRMLFFGGISVVVSIITNAGIWILYAKDCSLLRMMSISFSALFLFAWMDLWVEWRWAAPSACFAAPLIWGLFGITVSAFGERTVKVLACVPTAVFAAVTVITAVLFVRMLKKYYFGSKEGVLAHAVG